MICLPFLVSEMLGFGEMVVEQGIWKRSPRNEASYYPSAARERTVKVHEVTLEMTGGW